MNAREEVVVQSVDDNEFWLEKTRSFLADYGMPCEQLCTWAYFMQNNRTKFDLIIHDLGNMLMRIETFPVVLDALEEGGLIILDDMHNKRYRRFVNVQSRNTGFSLYSVRKHTLNKFGRFAEIAVGRRAALSDPGSAQQSRPQQPHYPVT